MIRTCGTVDIPWMLELCRKMHAESRYKRNSLNLENIQAILQQLLASPSGIVLRTDNGLLFGGVDTHWFGNDRYAYEYLLYVEPEARKSGQALELIDGYIAAAMELGVKPPEIQIEHSTSIRPEVIEALYERAGFVRIGGIFALEA